MNKKDKERITDFVEEIRETYRGILLEADFLSDATREKALEKLDVMGALVLYPDDWEHYDCSELDIRPPREGGRLWEALNAAEAQKTAMKLDQLNRPRDREEWMITPQFANCCYSSDTNCIQINGAFTRGGFYSSGMSKEEQLGMIGMVIAHEISHSFDSSGASFDALGNVADWWTPEDKAEFQNRVERLETYYSNIHPWEGFDLPAAILTGEACADMAGMKCILRVASETEDFDYDAFFRTYADLWMMEFKVSLAPKYLSDPHPQGYLRINSVLQQFDEFLDYYGITEGDGMYLAPEDRVAIW
jgi:putative endopeptidase